LETILVLEFLSHLDLRWFGSSAVFAFYLAFWRGRCFLDFLFDTRAQESLGDLDRGFSS
jgi:hypothetical protein